MSNEQSKSVDAAEDAQRPVEVFVMRDTEHIREAVAYLRNYMDTYDQQEGWENYTAQTFIDDVLYGLGVALDEDEYSFAGGYRAFTEKLKKHLGA